MTTKIKLPNIDTTYDYSSLVGSAYAQANGAFTTANGAFGQANTSFNQANAAFAAANTVTSTVTFNSFLLSGM